MAGQPVQCSPAAFREGTDVWAPADALAEACGVRLSVEAERFKLGGSAKSLPRRVIDGHEYVSVRPFAAAINASAYQSGNAMGILARITDVRYADGQIKVTTSLPVRYQVKRLGSPERIYIDFFNTRLEGPSGETRSKSSSVRALRVGQATPTTARVTAETTGRLSFTALSPGRSDTIALRLDSPGATVASRPPAPAKPSEDAAVDAGAGPVTIKNVQIDADDSVARLIISTDRPASPKFGQRLGQGMLWLDFDPSVVSFQDRQWQVDNSLIQQVRLDAPASSPPKARLVVQTDHVVVSRIKAGASPNELIWELTLPDGAQDSYRGRTVIIDPGHGGKDSGARGNGLQEKDVNLAIALATADEVKSRGLKPVLTRETDVFVSLGYRTDQIKPNGASLFVSIHSNSSSRANGTSGTEVYYHKQDPSSRALAEIVQDKIASMTDMPARGARSDSRLYQSGLFVLRNSSVPAVLVEVGYINHSGDAARLGDPEFQKKVAQAIAEGVVSYLGAPLQAKNQIRPGLGVTARYANAGAPLGG